MPETFFTVWTNVFERGRLQAGETILIHGGTSGIGTTAIQLAQRVRRAGVRDGRAATRSARRARELGADAAFNYRTDGLGRPPRRRPPAAAASTWSSTWSAATTSPATSSCSPIDGRLVQIAFLKSAKAEIDFSVMMRKRAVDHRLDAAAAHAGGEGRDRARAARAHVWPLLEAGTVDAGDPPGVSARRRRRRRTG